MKALITDFDKWQCYLVNCAEDCKNDFDKEIYLHLKNHPLAGVLFGRTHAIQETYLSRKELSYEIGKYYDI